MSKRLILILAVVATVSVLAIARTAGMEAALIYTGWALVITVLLSLIFYRLVLSYFERVARAGNVEASHRMLRWFHHQEDRVDHAAILLTAGGLVYTVGITVFLASRLFDKAVAKFMSLLSLR